jgi:hypothetical protein
MGAGGDHRAVVAVPAAARRPRPAAQWFIAHPVVPFVIFVYVFTTIVFGGVAFVAQIFGRPPFWLVGLISLGIGIVLTALPWRSQLTFWENRSVDEQRLI